MFFFCVAHNLIVCLVVLEEEEDVEEEDFWGDTIFITREMLSPSEAVKIGDHLFSLVLNEVVGNHQISYIAVATPLLDISKTEHHTGVIVQPSSASNDKKDKPGEKKKRSNRLQFTSSDAFSGNLEFVVEELRKLRAQENCYMLCQSFSAIDSTYRGQYSMKAPIKTTTYDFSKLDVKFSGEYFNQGAHGGHLKKLMYPVFTEHKFAGNTYQHVNGVVIWRIYIDGTAQKVSIPSSGEAPKKDDDMEQLVKRFTRV